MFTPSIVLAYWIGGVSSSTAESFPEGAPMATGLGGRAPGIAGPAAPAKGSGGPERSGRAWGLIDAHSHSRLSPRVGGSRYPATPHHDEKAGEVVRQEF